MQFWVSARLSFSLFLTPTGNSPYHRMATGAGRVRKMSDTGHKARYQWSDDAFIKGTRA